MALLPISDNTSPSELTLISFLDLKLRPLSTPMEWSEALVVLNLPLEEGQVYQLERQGQALDLSWRRLENTLKLVAQWPRSDAGRYRLTLYHQADGTSQLKASQVITVAPRKLTPSARDELLEDLERRLPASIALSLARGDALDRIEFRAFETEVITTLPQELIRLRHAIEGTREKPGLEKILRTLSRDYQHVLKTSEIWVREEQVRRPDPARIVPLLARGSVRRAQNEQPSYLPDSRVEHSPDTYENQLVKKYATQVEIALTRLLGALSRKSSLGEQERAALEEGQTLYLRFKTAYRVAKVAFLDEVKLVEYLAARPTQVIQKRPPYRASYEGYLDFHRRPTVRLAALALEAPLENLPFLYQMWGTFKVIDVLLKLAMELGYSVIGQNLLKKNYLGYLVQLLPNGKPVLELRHPERGTTVRLIPERSYSGRGDKTKTEEGLHSVSYDQRPDIAVEVRHAGRISPEIYLFDPKYKLESEYYLSGSSSVEYRLEPKKIDIDKMHAYRDAIRDATENRVVEYAAILYPGDLKTFNAGLAALPAYPGDKQRLEELEHALNDIFYKAF